MYLISSSAVKTCPGNPDASCFPFKKVAMYSLNKESDRFSQCHTSKTFLISYPCLTASFTSSVQYVPSIARSVSSCVHLTILL